MKTMQHTPWSDTADLITAEAVQDAEGYVTVTETPHTVYCSFTDGVSQSEFYLSQKLGMRASCQVEVHRADLAEIWPAGTYGDRFVDFNGVRYKVLRTAAETFDTVTLILTEVIR